MDINQIQKTAGFEGQRIVDSPHDLGKVGVKKDILSVDDSVKNKETVAKVSNEVIIEQSERVNKLLELSGQNLAFSVDNKTDSLVITLVDRETNEVLRQFPNENSLKIMQNIQEYLESFDGKSKFSLVGSLINSSV